MRAVLTLAFFALMLCAGALYAASGVSLTGVTLGSGGGGDWLATFGPCTAGVDCFCDTITTEYPNTLACEDWDEPAWVLDCSPGSECNTARGNYPNMVAGTDYGPDSDRGNLGIQYAKHGSANARPWITGEPGGTPTFGKNCVGPVCNGLKVWHPSDLWNANSLNPALYFIIEDGYDDDTSATFLEKVIPAAPAGTSVFGNAVKGLRVPQGEPYSAGFTGKMDTAGNPKAFSVTSASAYATNLLTSGVTNEPWKHDEFQFSGDGGADHALHGFILSGQPQSVWPAIGFIFSLPDCASTLSGMTVHEGEFECNAVTNLLWHAMDSTPGPVIYNFTNDWDIAEYHCVQTSYDFSTASSSVIKMWIDGLLVVHGSGIDMTGDTSANGLANSAWNHYANENQPGGGGTSATTYRYVDNHVIVSGTTPVSCQDIGVLP